MTEPLPGSPKRVDETWKAQIEQEKERLRTTTPPQATTGPAPQGTVTAQEPAQEPAGDQRFEALLSSLAMEAFIHLGDAPHPATNRPEPNVPQAKYIIDLLGMLETKTKGNLSAAESRQLGEFLYQLRMRYVEKTQPPLPPPPGSKEAAR